MKPLTTQVAVILRAIQTVADDELVRDGEADVIGIDVRSAAFGLVEQGADLQRGRLKLEQMISDELERQAHVDDVL